MKNIVICILAVTTWLASMAAAFTLAWNLEHQEMCDKANAR